MRNDATHAEGMSSDSSGAGVSPYRIFRAVGIGFSVMILAAGILWKVRGSTRPAQITRPDDPNSMRLLYVRPDCGEQVYDANGRLLGKIPVGNTSSYWWKPDDMKREFVFTCRNDNSLFPTFVSLYLNGWLARRESASLEVRDTNESWVTLSCRAEVPRTMLEGGLRLGPIRLFRPRKKRVLTVDAHITYHTGPRGPARATFVGPFRVGQQVRAQEDANVLMQVERSPASTVHFVLSGPPPVECDAPVLAYTAGGRRHSLGRGGSSTTATKPFRWEVSCRNLALKSITHITLNEKPATQVYRGIQVNYPDLPVRTHPAFLDEIAERLDLDVDLSDPYAVDAFVENTKPFDSPSQALCILDIARGDFLHRVMRTFQRIQPGDLTTAEREQLAEILPTLRRGERERFACHLGLWAGWPAYADKVLAILRDGDMGDLRFERLALALYRYPSPTAEQLSSLTDLLLQKSIDGSSLRDRLVNYVLRHSGSETEHLRRLAECDKPWIWSLVIRPDRYFREFVNKASPSRIVRKRAVALGMSSWIDQADALKPEAYELLVETITPEFYEKSYLGFDRVFKAFAEHTPADKGNEVLIQYLKRQQSGWKAWRQIEGASFWSDGGIWRVVRQLNSWNDVNIGGLGRDSDRRDSSVGIDWPGVTASALQWALHWARTGEDPGRLSPDWRMSNRDMRVVWHNRRAPEYSQVGLWPHGQDPNLARPYALMESGGDFLYYTVRPAGYAARGMPAWDFLIRAGVDRGPQINHEFTFTLAGVPKLFDPRRRNASSRRTLFSWEGDTFWHGDWEIWIEPGAAETSILNGIRLFSEWKDRYLADDPAVPPPKRVFSRDDLDVVPADSESSLRQ